MRFKSRCALRQQEGQTRIVRKFLLFPRQFGGEEDWRWLEYANMLEMVCKIDVGSYDWPVYTWRWEEVGFSDEE